MESAVARDTSTKPIVLGFSQLGRESAWRLANSTSIRMLRGIGNLPFNEKCRQFKLNSSRLFGRSFFIRQKVDVIAIAPVVESGWDGILQEARDAGIPSS